MATNNAINSSNVTFSAYLSSPVTNVTGDGTLYTVICDTTLINEGNYYNTTTGVYTVPVSGNYLFGIAAMFSGITSSSFTTAITAINVNATQYNIIDVNPYNTAADGGYCLFPGQIILPLSASDAVSFIVQVSGATLVVGLYGDTLVLGTRCYGQMLL